MLGITYEVKNTVIIKLSYVCDHVMTIIEIIRTVFSDEHGGVIVSSHGVQNHLFDAVRNNIVIWHCGL